MGIASKDGRWIVYKRVAQVPHLVIRAGAGRTLKTDHSRREIPLMGVSLDAASRLGAAGGCARYRYRHKGDAWSAKRFHAWQQAATMASWSLKTLIASQLALRYCQSLPRT